jgi:hypothetical protein
MHSIVDNGHPTRTRHEMVSAQLACYANAFVGIFSLVVTSLRNMSATLLAYNTPDCPTDAISLRWEGRPHLVNPSVMYVIVASTVMMTATNNVL